MRLFAMVVLVTCAACVIHAEEQATAETAKPKPLPAPSNARFNSTVSNNAKKPTYFPAPAGQALTADGTGLHTIWAFIKGTTIDSNVSGSPITNGFVLTADGNGGANWMLVSPSGFSGVLPIANGGTGSSTQNFVDLTSDQTVAGKKTLTGTLLVGTTFEVDNAPNNTGASNVFMGTKAGFSNTSGQGNTITGTGALQANLTGSSNAAYGYLALHQNTSAVNNTAIGTQTLYNNTTGGSNTAVGFDALMGNTTGSNNIAIGNGAGRSFDAGESNNIDIGNFGTAGESGIIRIGTSGTHTDAYLAGIVHADGGLSVGTTFEVNNAPNNTGIQNVFIGQNAGLSNTTAGSNVFVGGNSGQNTTGSPSNNNTFVGTQTWFTNTTGGGNTFVGYGAGQANTTGANNIAIGNTAGNLLTTGSNNIDIGNSGVAGESFAIRIGNPVGITSCFIAGINGVTVSGGAAVSILPNGQLGTITFSRRFKDNIQDMGASSDVLLSLRPVTFTYKKELDPKSIPQWGLIAEEVGAANPDLVVRDEKGVINTVRYEQINAMLLNEFLKEHKKVEELTNAGAELKKRLADLEARDKIREARLARIESALEDGRVRAVSAK